MSTSATQGGHNNLLICRTECNVADVVVCINWMLAALICATRRQLAVCPAVHSTSEMSSQTTLFGDIYP